MFGPARDSLSPLPVWQPHQQVAADNVFLHAGILSVLPVAVEEPAHLAARPAAPTAVRNMVVQQPRPELLRVCIYPQRT